MVDQSIRKQQLSDVIALRTKTHVIELQHSIAHKTAEVEKHIISCLPASFCPPPLLVAGKKTPEKTQLKRNHT